jgi:hypothetical protein
LAGCGGSGNGSRSFEGVYGYESEDLLLQFGIDSARPEPDGTQGYLVAGDEEGVVFGRINRVVYDKDLLSFRVTNVDDETDWVEYQGRTEGDELDGDWYVPEEGLTRKREVQWPSAVQKVEEAKIEKLKGRYVGFTVYNPVSGAQQWGSSEFEVKEAKSLGGFNYEVSGTLRVSANDRDYTFDWSGTIKKDVGFEGATVAKPGQKSVSLKGGIFAYTNAASVTLGSFKMGSVQYKDAWFSQARKQ